MPVPTVKRVGCRRRKRKKDGRKTKAESDDGDEEWMGSVTLTEEPTGQLLLA